MVGYELIHNTTTLMNALLIIVGVPIGSVALLVILLEVFYPEWYDDILGPTKPPAYDYGRANTNWGRLTDPYYDKEIEVNGVPVLYYKRSGKGYVATITSTIDCPSAVDWRGNKFTWTWITELKRSGWKQDNPPAQPSIIASPGMWVHIDRILTEEQAAETGDVTTAKAQKQA